jgi:hypothetical protein
MLNQVLSKFIKTPKVIGWLLFLLVTAMLSGLFFATQATEPYLSELSFIEHSNDGEVIGSVVPASCESNPPTNHSSVDCMCTISSSACGGGTCTITWSVNFNPGGYGPSQLLRDGVRVNYIDPSGSQSVAIPPSGSTVSLARNDGVVLCQQFVIGPPVPTVNVTGPSTVNNGESVTNLRWDVTNSASCVAGGGGWSGPRNANDGTHTEPSFVPAGSATYRLDCTGPGGSTSGQKTITINPPSLAVFTATPSTVNAGDTTTLNWTVNGASNCTATGAWGGNKTATNGSHSAVVTPTAPNQTYRLECTGPGGTTGVQSAVVTVNPPTLNFTATPSTVDGNQDTTLNWTVNGASNCTATGAWGGNKTATNGSYSAVVTPTAPTQTYSLECTGLGGTTGVYSALVTVNPPTLSFNSSKTIVDVGETLVLSWAVSGASACSAGGGPGWTGAVDYADGSYSSAPLSLVANTSYTLECTGSGGSSGQQTRLVKMPSGWITASTCEIPVTGSSCNSTVRWDTDNFKGGVNVSRGGVFISNSSANTSGLSVPVSIGDDTFTLRDTGGIYSRTNSALPTCQAGSGWNGVMCVSLPVINVTADPTTVRSGENASVNVSIQADYDLLCTVSGATVSSFVHNAAAAAQDHSLTTADLTSAQEIFIDCTSTMGWPTEVGGTGGVRIGVIPTYQET